MYKEMRAHFLNCDIKDLTWHGVDWTSHRHSTPVGLSPGNIYFSDSDSLQGGLSGDLLGMRDQTEEEESRTDDLEESGGIKQKDRKKQAGTYTPIFPTGITDMIASAGLIFTGDLEPMGKTIAKTITYATTGMLPFIDLSTAFQVPCADIDMNWKPDGKYDIGRFGRYGHPLSPLTAFALSTLQLPSDLEKRDNNCSLSKSPQSPEVSENECEDEEDL
jgi:hypothetical protein